MRSLVTLLSILSLCQARPWTWPNGALRPSLMKGGEQYIAGGTDALPGEFPWQLSVQRLSGGTWSHNSGATLLSATSGLTAAHLLDGAVPTSLRVVAGLHKKSDLTGTQTVDLSGYIMHEGYNSGVGTFSNDIAILVFATPVTFGGNVQPATLPVDDSNSYAGYTCVITGWGSTGVSSPDVLQKASILAISNAECSAIMASVPGAIVSDSQICVYDPAQIVGVCSGDSGGPLNCPDGVTRVVGVSSWLIADGPGGCQQTYPAVFTRVSSYLDWITANTP